MVYSMLLRTIEECSDIFILTESCSIVSTVFEHDICSLKTQISSFFLLSALKVMRTEHVKHLLIYIYTYNI